MLISLLRYIDKYIIGALLFCLFPLKYISKSTSVKHPKKILVVRVWALGSTLLTMPMVEQLQKHYGSRLEYDVLASTRNIGIFKNQGAFNDYINLFSFSGLIKLLRRFKYYDIVIDCEEYFRITSLISLRVGKVTVGYNNILARKMSYIYGVRYEERRHNIINCLSLLSPLEISWQSPSALVPMKYTSIDQEKVEDFLAQNYIKHPVICMHVAGAETSHDRFWSTKNRIDLIKMIKEQYEHATIFLSGGMAEREANRYILQQLPSLDSLFDLSGIFSLQQFAYLLKKTDIMISNDTGPMHLSACMGTKTIGLFGPNIPEAFGPWPLTDNIGLYKGTGNIYIKPHLGQFDEDPDKLVDKITPEEVFHEIKSMLSRD